GPRRPAHPGPVLPDGPGQDAALLLAHRPHARRGEFRGDLAYVFPSVTAGLSARVDLLGSGFVTFGDGALATPLVGLKGQVYDGESAKVALGTSALFTFGGDRKSVV